jgi:hypothetical protein
MINPLKAAFSAITSGKVPAPISSETKKGPELAVESPEKTEKKATDKASFSTLASQLNESAARAAKRDAGMTHAELGKYGLSRINEFLSEAPKANSHTRAMEVPDTTDPELLDRARAATAFVTQTLAGHQNAKSPFDTLSREQLNLIAYDDSGAFTLNERRAAWHGIQKMDDAWRKVAIPEGMLEQTRTGKASKFYQEALSYFKSLPTIEKAVDYPKDADAILEARIKSNPTLPTPATMPGIIEGRSTDRKLTLYDILAGVVDTQKDKVDPNTPARTKKFSPRTSPTPLTWTEQWANKEALAVKASNPTWADASTTPVHGIENSAVKKTEVATNATPGTDGGQ